MAKIKMKTAAVKTGTSKLKIGKKRMIITGVMLVLTGLIWYEVGSVVFGFTKNSGYFSEEKAPVLSDEAIVASINGTDVRLKDVKAFAKNIPQLADLPFNMIYPQLLETMINNKVMLQSAEASGVENDEEVQKMLKLAREQVLFQAYLSQQLESQMTPEKLKELYMAEMKNFERQEEVRARHILLGSKKEAEDAIVQLNAGVDFALLANTKSLDTENKGGSLGYFTKNMMIPEFGDAVFAMKKGQLSAPIKTPFGWHVVLVEDRRLAAPPAFEDVQDQLKQIYAERNAKNIVVDERQKANVKVIISRIQ